MHKHAQRNPARLLATMVPVLAAAAAQGHQFWISPSAYIAPPDSLIRVELFHGPRFAGQNVGRDDSQIDRYDLVMGGEATPVRGMYGASQGFLRPQTPGSGVLVYTTHEHVNVLPAERFEVYLSEEGLDWISQQRARLGETGKEGREAYMRCAKALVNVTDAPTAVPHDMCMNLPYEILLDDLGDGASGSPVGARVLFEGAPLEGMQVVAVSAAHPDKLIALTSDAEGHVAFTPEEGGPWMLTSLQMVRDNTREDVDWKSYWASLTFSLPAGESTRHAEK
ncbi:MAG: DUF4198 domain-containing protein [Phycisphaerales bacterium]|nr:DUF4198 domain-containing protein [Phycisphaerales bacterium]